jgi:glycosyltransferase involved in cell wall biosynthesis
MPGSIIILNQFFYPDYSATSILMTELAEGFLERGISVTAVASRGLYRGGKLSNFEEHKGVRIERCWATAFGKANSIGRLADYLSFYWGATWKLLRIQRHDVIMTLSTPPLIGCIGLVIGRLRGMRVIALEQDVYPEVAIALGALKKRSILTRVLLLVSRAALRYSDGVIVLSECMRRKIAKKISTRSAPPITVIHNWADGRVVKPSGRSNWFTEKYQLLDKFVILFAGNFGRVNDFATVLEAAKLLKAQKSLLFLFVGGGDKAQEIEAFQRKHCLENLRLLPYHKPSQMSDILASSQVSLVTLSVGLAGLSVPSKTYWSLAAGRPILFVGDLDSEIAQLVEANSCGAAIPSGDSQKLADVLTEWAFNRAALEKLGSASRILFETRFDRRYAIDAYTKTFFSVIAPKHIPAKRAVLL